MKRTSIVLNLILLLSLAGYIGFRCLWRQSVAYSSTSTDGKWRRVVTDIDPSPYQVTLVYSVQAVGSPFPLSSTQYISYEDSALPGEVKFEWSQNVWSSEILGELWLQSSDRDGSVGESSSNHMRQNPNHALQRTALRAVVELYGMTR